MRNLGRLDDLNLGMGLTMSTNQVVKAPYASLDGVDIKPSILKWLLLGVVAVIAYQKLR